MSKLSDIMDMKRFINQCKRVLKIATKPTKTEYLTEVKIVSIGILLIGTIGFLIFLLFNLLGAV